MRRVRRAIAGLAVAAVAVAASAPAAPRSAQQREAATFRVTVKGASHVAHAGHRWRYSVSATNAEGNPVAGTAIVRVVLKGRVVDTVGWFGFKGTLRKTYRWPARLTGRFAVFQAKVIGPKSTRIAGYGVHVRSSYLAVTGHPTFRFTLTTSGHTARAGVPWRYTVRTVDTAGRPVSGTAIVRVLVNGSYVDTVGLFGMKGVLRKTYRWSPNLKGKTALFQVRVVGPGGTRAVRYQVKVH